MTKLTRVPSGVNRYDDMFVSFAYRQDTDSERVILYAMARITTPTERPVRKPTESELIWIPGAGLYIHPVPVSFIEDIRPFLPLEVYSGWAHGKCDKNDKWKTHSGTAPMQCVIPMYLWR